MLCCFDLFQAVYWDGFDVYSDVRSYVNDGHRGLTLEFTLVGYIMNGYLYFCGQTEYPGIKYDSCPQKGDCGGDFPEGSIDAFWAAASVYVSSIPTMEIDGLHMMSLTTIKTMHGNVHVFAQPRFKQGPSNKLSHIQENTPFIFQFGKYGAGKVKFIVNSNRPGGAFHTNDR